MKVAVTGASGHIGNCLVRELVKQGARVKILVNNRESKYQEDGYTAPGEIFRNDRDETDVELFHGNILEPESLIALCKDADVVFHLAAQIAISNKSSRQVFETNVTGTKNILKAAASSGAKKFIHFSSIHAFQTEPTDQLLDESRPMVETTKTIYEFTKAEGEREVMKAVKEGLNAVIVNPTAVIGPFDYRGSLLGLALLQIYQNKLPFLISGGYNWVDVRDIVSASVQAIESGRKGEKYILSGEFRTLKELSVIMSKVSGCRIPVIVPGLLARLAVPFFQIYSSIAKTDPLYTSQSLDIIANSPVNISNEKARKELGYSPRPLDVTLRDTFNWYRENNFIN
jgi:dihydroflavonol-4-reductase